MRLCLGTAVGDIGPLGIDSRRTSVLKKVPWIVYSLGLGYSSSSSGIIGTTKSESSYTGCSSVLLGRLDP